MAPRSTVARLLVALVLLVLGAVVGLAAVLLHGITLGLVLAVVATALAAYALPGGWWRRLPFALGWDAALGLGVVPRSGGGYLVAADVRGYALLVVGLLLLLYATATLRPWPAPDDDAPERGSQARDG